MRDSRIKEYIFTPVSTSTAAVTGSEVTDHVINGTIHDVEFKYGAVGATGSITLNFLTSDIAFFSNIALSGAGTQIIKPGLRNQLSTGSGAGGIILPYTVNDKIVYNYTALLSGTSANAATIRIRYI